jgi:PKD repeat protein
MKKALLLITIGLAMLLPADIVTNPSDGAANVGDTIWFRLTCIDPASANWNWGDGQSLSGVSANLDWHGHAYINPGVFTVHMHRYNFLATPNCLGMVDEYRTVTILENRLINSSPTNPMIGQMISFTASNFNTPSNITWVMGDGTTLSHAGNSISHAYPAAGNYTIRAYDWNGNTSTVPVTLILNISSDKRSIVALPAKPIAGQPVTFSANNFQTPSDITWDMGDGTIYAHRNSTISHTYVLAGSYTIKAFDWNGNTKIPPVTLSITVIEMMRVITFSPNLPRVDQEVAIQAVNFKSSSIDWNFGDSTPPMTYSATIVHRYQNPGTFTISAKEQGMNLVQVTQAITILPENRSIILSANETMKDKPLTITAINFRSNLILWDFGDGTVMSGSQVMAHTYKRPGNYLITARDENGASEKKIQAPVKILGISDQVNLEIAEITLDNGKYYKVVPKNSPNIRALLKMKLRGTGIVSGYWIVDEKPYQFFNETVYQGQIKTIITPEIPGLPVFDPGMHTITVQLTRPQSEAVVFPTMRYFVLPYENVIATLSPRDGAVLKEDQVANFSWQRALGGSYYQISFANSLFPLLRDAASLKWLNCPDGLNFTPQVQVWNAIPRNQWTYWKVRALDSAQNIVAESSVQELKIIIPGAEIGIQKITDMDGKSIALGGQFTACRNDQLLVHGQLTYPGDAEYLILRVYANDELVDQLLFRDVKKDERKMFETSVPNMEKESRVIFEVLKSSSPSVVIGYAELNLKRE